jgi:uncharacterized damage-inducible protein DinB
MSMINMDHVRVLYDYNYWAHRKVWGCAMTLSEEAFTRDLAYSMRSIRGQLVHTMGAERLWFARMRGVMPTTMAKEDEFSTRDLIRHEWDLVEHDIRVYLQSVTNEMLTQPFRYQTMKGDAHEQPMWQILLHVLNHATDHRAQTLAMLHQLGAPTVEQDMIYYFRERAPQAAK